MPTSTGSSTPTSKSGIQTSSSGDSYIPSSVRPDGSTRKQIKVRPGYKPPEDVEVYKNRTAQAWKTRGSGGVPGVEGLNIEDDDDSGGKANNKNAKRREARKKAAVASKEDDTPEGVKSESKGTDVMNKENWRAVANRSDKGDSDEEAEKEKKARNLKKKLRQARDLREKKDSGESLLPEQFAKVVKIQELIRDLDKLGFDAEGEKKGSDTGAEAANGLGDGKSDGAGDG